MGVLPAEGRASACTRSAGEPRREGRRGGEKRKPPWGQNRSSTRAASGDPEEEGRGKGGRRRREREEGSLTEGARQRARSASEQQRVAREERKEGCREHQRGHRHASSICLGGGKGKGRGRERREGEERDLSGRGKRPRCEPSCREGGVGPVGPGAEEAARFPRAPRLVRRGRVDSAVDGSTGTEAVKVHRVRKEERKAPDAWSRLRAMRRKTPGIVLHGTSPMRGCGVLSISRRNLSERGKEFTGQLLARTILRRDR